MMTVHDILERARASGQRLPPGDAGLLFAAAMRLASAQGATLRSRLVQLDEQGALHLLPFDDQQPELEPGYLAPEMLAADAPRKSEPRVQVYAAGALGFELLTGKDPRGGLEGDLPAPLGDIVKLALSPDRRERFGDLTQLYDAVEGAQPRAPLEKERQVLAVVHTRNTSVSPEKEALAKLISQMGDVQRQVAKMSASHRDVLERVERFDDGQRLSPAPKRGTPVVLPFLAGLVGALAVLGAAWALGLVHAPAPVASVKEAPAPVVREEALRDPAPEVDAGKGGAADTSPGATARAAEARSRAAGSDAVTASDAGSAANVQPAAGTSAAGPSLAPTGTPPSAQAAAPPPAAPPDALPGASPEAAAPLGAPAESSSWPLAGSSGVPLAVTPDGAPDAAKAAAIPPAPPQPSPASNRSVKKRSRSDVSPAMMAHAVAQSQVKRGEDALEAGHIDEALQSFRAAIENEPTNGPAWRGVATAYSMQSNDAQALQAYEKYLGVAPNARDAAEIRTVMSELKARARLGGEEK